MNNSVEERYEILIILENNELKKAKYLKCNAAIWINKTSATSTSNKKAMLTCFYTLKYRVTYVFIHCYCWIGYFAVFIPFILNICKLKYMFSLNIVHSEWANLSA